MSRDLMRIAEESARGSFFLVSGAFSATFISALTAIFVARFLGPELYGQYALSLLLPEMVLVVANFGIAEGVVKFVSSYHEEGELARIPKIIKHAMLLRLLTGFVFFLLNFALADFFATSLFHRPALGVYIRIASVSTLSHVVYITAVSAYLGLNKPQYRALTVNIHALSKAVISIALLLLGFNVLGAVLGYVIGLIAGGIAGFGLLSLFLRKHTQSKGPETFKQSTKTLLRYGIPLYLSQLLVSVIPSYQNLVLATLTTTAEIGNLKAATNFITFISIFAVQISTALFPAFSKLNSNHRTNGKISTFFSIANKYTSLMIVPISTFFLIFSRDIIQLVYGSTYGDAALFLSIYCPLYFLVGLGYLNLRSLFNGLGKTWTTFKMRFVAFIVVLVLSPALAGVYGSPGIILAFITAEAASTGYGMYIAKRNLRIRFNVKSSMKIYLVASLSMLPSLLTLQAFSLSGLPRVVVGGSLYLLMYVTLAPVLGIVSFSELETAGEILKKIEPLAKLVEPLFFYQRKLLSLKTTNKLLLNL